MNRITAWTVCGLCLSVAACGGSDDAREASQMELSELSEATPIVESGCLTASGDRFVLTALERAGEAPAGPATELYQLVGVNEDLQAHVGKEVRVTGEATPAEVAEVAEVAPPAPVATSGGTGNAQPQVITEAETRFETRKLRVTAISPLGGAC